MAPSIAPLQLWLRYTAKENARKVESSAITSKVQRGLKPETGHNTLFFQRGYDTV